MGNACALDRFDIQVCEAQADVADKISCWHKTFILPISTSCCCWVNAAFRGWFEAQRIPVRQQRIVERIRIAEKQTPSHYSLRYLILPVLEG